MRKELDEFLAYLKHERNASVHTISSYRIDLTQLADYLDTRKIRLPQVDNVVLSQGETVVPEPFTAIGVSMGIVGIAGYLRRRGLKLA